MPSSSQRALAVITARGRHTAQRSEGEHVLVLHALLAAAFAGVDVLAADRAGRAAVAGDLPHPGQLFRGQPGRLFEGGGREVAGGQAGHSVEGQEVGQGVRVRGTSRWPGRSPRPQVTGQGQDLSRVVHRAAAPRFHQYALEVLGSEHGAQTSPAGVPAVVADGGVTHPDFAGRADGRRTPASPVLLLQRLLGRGGRQTGQLRRRHQAHLSASTSSTDNSAARPRITMASLPVSFPEIAKWLDANASVSNPVRGDLATTANLALVGEGSTDQGSRTRKPKGRTGPAGRYPPGPDGAAATYPTPHRPGRPGGRVDQRKQAPSSPSRPHVDHQRPTEVPTRSHHPRLRPADAFNHLRRR